MRKIVLLTILATISATICAQSIREELIADFDKAGSNYYAYPGPQRHSLLRLMGKNHSTSATTGDMAPDILSTTGNTTIPMPPFRWQTA